MSIHGEEGPMAPDAVVPGDKIGVAAVGKGDIVVDFRACRR
jgi:hypothetical protein